MSNRPVTLGREPKSGPNCCQLVRQIAGHSVLLRAFDADSLGHLVAALGAAPSAALPAHLTLEVHPGSLDRPDREPDQVVQHISYWTDGESLLVSTTPSQLARVSEDAAVLDPGIAGGVRDIHALLLPVLTLLFAQRGMSLVHAGAYLDAAKGGAVLVLGGSGQGKSTMIAAALAAGRVVISDDLAVLRLDEGRLVVGGVPQPLALPADLHREAVVGVPVAGDPRDRRAAAVPVTLNAGWHPVAATVMVGHADQPEGSLHPAQPREIFHQLLASTVDGIAEGRVRTPFPCAAALARLPGWHLGHSNDAVRRIAAARHWVLDEGDRTAASAGATSAGAEESQ
jgi:hypothetical protein